MKYVSVLVVPALVSILFIGVSCQNKKGPEVTAISSLRRIHYDFDRASIRPDMVPILDGNSKYLKKHEDSKVIVEGHCDERGTNEYNLALGDRRAHQAKSYLINRGIKENRIRTISYGEERPLSYGHDESAWYMNRRSEFVKQ